MLHRLLPLLAHRHAPLFAGAVGMLLCLPAVGTGLMGDDYLWWEVLQGRPPLSGSLPAIFQLYNFIPGGLDLEVLREQGMLTWWAGPDLSVAMLRPLSALTCLLDHALFPEGFAWQHLHSLAWYGASVALVGLLYRRAGRGLAATAGLAALLYAVDDAHALNAGWLANRHALVSLVMGMLAFLAHLRWREGGGLRWAAVALAVLGVGLFCGESTLGAAAYIVAWQVAGENGPWRQRLAPVLPYAVLVVAWRLVYDAMGYGISGSGLYVDPGRDPLAFAGALLSRWPLLHAGQWVQLPVDAAVFLPSAVQVGLSAGTFAICAGLVWLLWPLLQSSRLARFLALGTALAAVPLCAAFPMDRLLAFAGVGASGLLALLAARTGWLGKSELAAAGPPLGSTRRRLTGLLLVLHLPVAAVLLVGRTATLPVFNQLFSAAANTAPREPEVSSQSFLFLSGHEFPTAYLPIIRRLRGEPGPARTALLATMAADNHVHRESARTLVVTPEGGFLKILADRLERSLRRPFVPGERYEMPDFTAEIREVTPDGRPRTVAFHFEHDLDDPRYRWLSWGSQGAEPFLLPEIGGSRTIPAQPLEAFFTDVDFGIWGEPSGVE